MTIPEIINAAADIQNTARTFVEYPDFYFQKGQDALKKWLNMSMSDQLQRELTAIAYDYDGILAKAENNESFRAVIELLFEIVSYCDVNARGKNQYNQYENKRTLADASVRMNNWLQKLIQFRFDRENVKVGSIQNALNYLLQPETNSTILSENHRRQISQNLFKKSYDRNTFNDDLKDFFAEYNLEIRNHINYTEYLSMLIYRIEELWKEEVIGLMASDGTGWQEKHIAYMSGYDASVIWNTKRPSGTKETLGFLREIIDAGKTFYLYYATRGFVNFRAIVVNFAENQEELNNQRWQEKYKSILHYHPIFSDYSDEAKQASIVFLASSLEKIEPIPVSDFKFYGKYDAPRQDNLSPLTSEPKLTVSSISKENNMNEPLASTMPLNQILFGPPGTGKTYNSISKALKIIGEEEEKALDWHDRRKIKTQFDKRVSEGRIVFTTFHQSMSYEDFIEGLKPLEPKADGQPVIYKNVDGILKAISEQAKANKSLASLKTNTSDEVLFEALFDQLKQNVENASLEEPVVEPNQMKKGLVIKLQTSFFSITAINGSSIRMMTRNGDERPTLTRNTLKLIFENPANAEQYVVGGMRTYYKALVDEMSKWKADVKAIAQTVRPKNFVLIIDEINRGNISQIFGELITLIEEDKRFGNDESLEVTLPYSKSKFSIPPNLYIVGTMNTADRGVEALDTALRRRFSFEFTPPNSALLINGKNEDKAVSGISLRKLLDILNQRITYLLDEDHQIGHAYFLSIQQNNVDQLKEVFKNKIIPLLKEYFFNDHGKIRLVLGDTFVKKSLARQTFAVAEDSDFILDKTTYSINSIDNNFDIVAALKKTIGE